MLSPRACAATSTCRIQHAPRWLPASHAPVIVCGRPHAQAHPGSPLAIDYGTVHVGISWRDGERNVPICTLRRQMLSYQQLTAALVALALALGTDGFLVGVPLFNPSKLNDDDMGKALASQLHRCRMLAAVLAVFTSTLGMSVLIMDEAGTSKSASSMRGGMAMYDISLPPGLLKQPPSAQPPARAPPSAPPTPAAASLTPGRLGATNLQRPTRPATTQPQPTSGQGASYASSHAEHAVAAAMLVSRYTIYPHLAGLVEVRPPPGAANTSSSKPRKRLGMPPQDLARLERQVQDQWSALTKAQDLQLADQYAGQLTSRGPSERTTAPQLWVTAVPLEVEDAMQLAEAAGSTLQYSWVNESYKDQLPGDTDIKQQARTRQVERQQQQTRKQK